MFLKTFNLFRVYRKTNCMIIFLVSLKTKLLGGTASKQSVDCLKTEYCLFNLNNLAIKLIRVTLSAGNLVMIVLL